jgi:putative membrane protein
VIRFILRTVVAIAATGVGLLVAALLLDGLKIDGVVTWIAATLIVWLGALLATWILPFLGLKKFLDKRRD